MATSTQRPGAPARSAPRRRVAAWLLQGAEDPVARHQGPHRKATEDSHRHPWWKVICLTGVDYFSTLGYQPGIAALAAGSLSPLATLVLVLLTVFGALPVYRTVARESPHGEGSIAMLEHLLPWWAGKLFVLALLGFAATDFLITITLSAADATAHIIENPFAPQLLQGEAVLVTLALLALLAAVFLRGFTEAIGIAVGLVGVYLGLNLVLTVVALARVLADGSVVIDWGNAMTAAHGSPVAMVAVALLVFPRLALGLSGFETGVAVMPQVRGDSADTEDQPRGRITDTRKLLTTAALIMSVFLLTSSFTTTVLIPAQEFQPGGQANGRALAYLAHSLLGAGFGTAYDLSTIAILWFAGASAMAGLLNLVPRYLPRYGMAPSWARAVRPLVLVFTAIGVVVTVVFQANVDAQSGAYATGVLVLITSASVAVTLSARRRGRRRLLVGFALVAVVFAYTTVVNVVERPEGLKIASLFILGILVISLLSRVGRAFELRATQVHFDATARQFVDEAAAQGVVRIVANELDSGNAKEYRAKTRQQHRDNHVPDGAHLLFFEVTLTDTSDFESALDVVGTKRHGYRVLTVRSSNIPNTVAAVLLTIRDETGTVPHVYFEWTEGNPAVNFAKFLLVGEGEVAPVAREVLRRAEPDRARRPHVHVG